MHLPTLRRLAPRDVFVHPYLPHACRDALAAAGVNVREAPFFEPVKVGALGLRFLPGGAGAMAWERGSAALQVEAEKAGTSLLFQGETSPAPTVARRFKAGRLRRPTLAILTYNLQTRGGARTGVFGNARGHRDLSEPLDAVAEALGSWIETLGGRPEGIAFAGSGFLTCVGRQAHGFDGPGVRAVGKVVDQLSARVPVWGAEGRMMLRIDEAGVVDASAPGQVPVASPAAVLPSSSGGPPAWDRIEADLRWLSRMLALAPLGRLLVAFHRFRGRDLGPARLALILDVPDAPRCYAFDVRRNEFCRAEIPASPEATYPFVLRMPAAWFASLFDGGAQIWDLSMAPHVRQWYLGLPGLSPLAFLYTALSETVRPDLAAAVYRRILAAPPPTGG